MLDLERENLFDCCHLPQRRQEVAVNRTELIETVATTAGLDKKQAEAAVSAFVDSIIAQTKSGEQVSIFGFGSFKPTARAARMGRNPQTNEAVKIPARKSVKFAAGTAFKAALNPRTTKKAAAPAKKTAAAKSEPAKKAVAPAKKTAAATKTAATKTAAAAKKAPVARKAVTPAKKAAGVTKKR
jgi:DNA-binding protein HU-beta